MKNSGRGVGNSLSPLEPPNSLQLELVRVVALVASEGLLDMPKGLFNTFTFNHLMATFESYYDLLNHVQSAKLIPFIFETSSYVPIFKKIAARPDLQDVCLNFGQFTSAGNKTYEALVEACHLLSRDTILGLFDQLAFNKATCGFALLQTPGPTPDKTKTSEALAIALALQRQLYSRVLVINWDKDHCSGLQEAFYGNANVVCISLHRTALGTTSGLVNEVGSGEALGKNINCPFPVDKFLFNDLLYAFQHLVLPIALEFQPDVVVVPTSLDFELARESKFPIPPDVYGHMLYTLQSLAYGKVAISLECDCTLAHVAPAVYAMLEVLLGISPKRLSDPVIPTASGAKAVAAAIKAQAPYWKSMAFDGST